MNKLSQFNNIINLNHFKKVEPIQLTISEISTLPTTAILSIINEKGYIISRIIINNGAVSLHRIYDFYVLVTEIRQLNSTDITYKLDYLNKQQAVTMLNTIFLDLR